MKILIADIYPYADYRLIKDTAGGYGTGNDFSGNIFLKFLNKFLGSMLSMPPMSAIYVYSILKNKGHEVDYVKSNKDLEIREDYDFYIIPSSIIACESEADFVNKIIKKEKPVFLIGIFSNIKSNLYNKEAIIIKGEPEKFFLENELTKDFLDKDFLSQKANENGMLDNLDILPFPKWYDYLKIYKLKNNFLGYNSAPAIPIHFQRGMPLFLLIIVRTHSSKDKSKIQKC